MVADVEHAGIKMGITPPTTLIVASQLGGGLRPAADPLVS